MPSPKSNLQTASAKKTNSLKNTKFMKIASQKKNSSIKKNMERKKALKCGKGIGKYKSLCKPSGFKAYQKQTTNFNGGKLYFQYEDFDLANEYDPVTSIFKPKQDGVYVITVCIEYSDPSLPRRTEIGITIENSWRSFHLNSPGSAGVNTNMVTNTFSLKAGDEVGVNLFVEGSGSEITLTPLSHLSSYFTAVRVPS